ncbi:MAG: prolipoprotein diacylglyceryl transferase, partial [Acidobacteriaceae bacterium]
ALSLALARRTGLDAEKIWNLGLIGVVTAIVGARLLLAIANWSSFRAAPLLLLRLSGLGFPGVRSPIFALGGCAIALLFCAAYALRTHLPLLRTLDVAAPALALGHAFACIGCFAAGCGYGRPASVAWGVTFTSRFAARTTGVPLGVPLHPVQLYQSAVSFALVALLLMFFGRRHRDGEIMGAWLFLSGVAGFFLDFLRGDATPGPLLSAAFTVGQSVAIVMVLAGGLLWLRPRRSQKEAVLAG